MKTLIWTVRGNRHGKSKNSSLLLIFIKFFHNSRLIRWVQQKKIYRLDWAQCGAVIESYSCMDDSVQFI